MKINFSNKDTAIIIIDLQNDYVHEQGIINKFGLGTKELQSKVPKIQEFIEFMRKKSFKIIHIQMTEARDFIDINLKKKRIETFGDPENWELAIPGTWGHELLLEVKESEPIFKKNTYDVFSNPEVQEYLKENNIKNLIILGGYTHACVDTTVRSGFTKSFSIILATDLVGSPDKLKELHENSLKNLTTNFCLGLTSNEIINNLN